MSDPTEDRLRRALAHPPGTTDTLTLLDDVHRGAARRRVRRTAGAGAAAGVLAVLAAVLTGTGLTDGSVDTGPAKGGAVSPAPTAKETSATEPPGPAVALTGTSGFDASPDGRLWRLVSATCDGVPCALLLHDDGTGEKKVRYFEFEGGEPAFPDLPPVELVRASDDGRDVWVFGQQLWSSHDGGATWTQQRLDGFEARDRVRLEVVGDDVYALQSAPVRLWRSPAGSDAWAPVDGPGGYPDADHLTSLGDSPVVSATSVKGLRMLLVLADGGWREALAPCQGEVGPVRTTGSLLVAPCPFDPATDPESLRDAQVVLRRSTDGDRWAPWAGVRHSSYVDATVPVDDDTTFVVTPEGGLLVTADGQERVDLPMDGDDIALVGLFPTADRGYLLVTGPQRLLTSEDGGRTWSRVD